MKLFLLHTKYSFRKGTPHIYIQEEKNSTIYILDKKHMIGKKLPLSERSCRQHFQMSGFNREFFSVQCTSSTSTLVGRHDEKYLLFLFILFIFLTEEPHEFSHHICIFINITLINVGHTFINAYFQ